MLAKPLRLMIVLGTRPEATKLAAFILQAQADKRFTPIIVNTGQHREMLLPILAWFNIQPHHTLDVMEPGQPLAKLTGKLLNGLYGIMEQEAPDIVCALGDTTTAFMAALATYYGYDYFVREERTAGRRAAGFAHLEAGLRTHNLYAPFPEEANRQLISKLAKWHLAPTRGAAENLGREGVKENVFVTGNPQIDTLTMVTERLKAEPMPAIPGLPTEALTKPFVLITGHRRENYGDGFQHICHAIAKLAKRFPTHSFIYPVHLNKHVQGPVHELLGNIENVYLTPPQDYPAFVYLMQHSLMLLTDSGGMQEEGPALGKPVLVMRDVTERPEGIEAGTAKLVGTDEQTIFDGVAELLTNPSAYQAMAQAVNPYGDGFAGQRILNILAGEKAEANTFNPLRRPAE